MDETAVRCLACPVCGEAVAPEAGSLRCVRGHCFDVARHGYVNLLPGDARPGTADTSEMVAARDAFLGAGHFAPLEAAVAGAACAAVSPAVPGCVIDAGAGTGRYLAAVLDALPGRVGVALDISKHAARRAARAHARGVAVVTDVWGRLPIATGAAALVLDVFAPRNAEEFARVLGVGGALIVVTPAADHLLELVERMPLVRVDPGKDARLEAALGDLFELARRDVVEAPLCLSREDTAALVGMGPASRHLDDASRAVLATLPEPFSTRLSALVTTYRPRGA